MKELILAFLILAVGLVLTNVVDAKDGLSVGTEIYYFNYEEPDFMEDTGAFYGINASYTEHFNGFDTLGIEAQGASEERFMARLDGRFAYGQVDYTSTSTGKLDNINDFVFETSAALGYDFNVIENALITPYIGLGYRYLNDDTGGRRTTTNAAGYERESHYFYLPIGIDVHGPLNEEWYANFNIEFDVFLQGRQKSHLGDAIAGLNTVNNDQENGYGVRGSLRFMKDNEKADLFIEPFVRYWHIDDSDISAVTYGGVLVGYGLEPENKTLEVGAKVGLNF